MLRRHRRGAVKPSSGCGRADGHTWNATFAAPADGTGLILWSEVICLLPPFAFNTPQASFGVYCAGGGGSLLTFAPDNLSLITAMNARKLRATT